MPLQKRVAIPNALADEALHVAHIPVSDRQGHRLDRLAWDRQQKPLQVLQTPDSFSAL
jgi:hypothetical protein